MTKRKITNPNKAIMDRVDGEDELRTSTRFALSPAYIGASSTRLLNDKGSIPNDLVSLHYTKELMEEAFKKVKDGDLTIAEEILTSQAVALNVAFNSFSMRAGRQQDVTTIKMFLQLALKAQNQCRSTLDSLRELKQPSGTQFIKQANIAQNQQINHGLVPAKNLNTQNELLEGSNERMDRGEETQAKRVNSTMEAVGAINGTKDTRGKSKGIS
jgi:hypothetical protein